MRWNETRVLVNCPIVPAGSTAAHRLKGSDTGLHMGWYRNKVVFYFNFSEAPLMVAGTGEVPVSPIYVTFNAYSTSRTEAPPPFQDEDGFAPDSQCSGHASLLYGVFAALACDCLRWHGLR